MLKEYADRLQLQLQRVKDVGKVELVGLQDQKIWIELSNTKAAQLGIPVTAIQEALQKQNSINNAGFFETGTDRIQIRVTGALQNVDDLKHMPLLIGNRTIQLGDVAEVYRGFSEPAQPRMRFMGENGIGIAVSMRKGEILLRSAKIYKVNLIIYKRPCRLACNSKKYQISLLLYNVVFMNLLKF